MDATTQKFARRCLPLLVANQAGWFIKNPHTIHATWTGRDGVEDVLIESDGSAGSHSVASHFGHGIVTWILPYLFRSPKGMNLLVRGPANWPKDGVSPLEGIVETDWAVSTFTMNWKITRPNHRVTFEAGEPICMLVPQTRGELESFNPVLADIGAEPEVSKEYSDWRASRDSFLSQLKVPGSEAAQAGWQRDYFRGQSPVGTNAPEHQIKLQLRGFHDE